MRIALACPSLEVLGGRERDCLAVARELADQGHRISLVTAHAVDPAALDLPREVETFVLEPREWTNHGRQLGFARNLRRWMATAGQDAVVGFAKLPGVTHYYGAERPWPKRSAAIAALHPRYRTQARLERDMIADPSPTILFFLTDRQEADYRERYRISPSRVRSLPVTLHGDRRAPAEFYSARSRVRERLGLPRDASVLINVATYAQQKGVDRVIRALPALGDVHFISVGLADPAPMEMLAGRLGVGERTRFLGYTDGLADLVGASDLMVHPARIENTGNVIVESLLYGVPVIVSDICGYAMHVSRSGGGLVLAEPVDGEVLAGAVRDALEPRNLTLMRSKARDYSPLIAAGPGMSGIARIIADEISGGR